MKTLQHVCVCACYCMGWVAVGIAACARQLEWKQHCPKPTTHENIFHPPCFIFNQTFVALTVRFQSDLSSPFLVDQTSNWILVRRRSIVNLFLFDLSKYGSHHCVMSMSEVIMNAWEDSITKDGLLEINNLLNWKEVTELFLIGGKTDGDKVVS